MTDDLKKRSGLEILDQYGACIMLVLLLTSYGWVKPLWLWIVGA